MAKENYDGVIEAVHYLSDGQVDWVRGYFRRGITWTDRIIIKRQALVDEMKSGKKMVIGHRTQLQGGLFEVSTPVQLVGKNGKEFLATSSAADSDRLEGLPIL